MPRARSQNQIDWQTAAVPQQGSGCLSGYILPPLAVLLIGCLLAAFVFNTPGHTKISSTTNSSTSNSLSPIFTAEVQYWANDIQRWSSTSSLDPNLVAVIMQIESCGDPRARSRAGAMGLFQVMPSHFRAGDNPYDPDTNAARGLTYLSRSLTAAQGDASLALAGYNGGIGVITRSQWLWASETKRYVHYGAPIYEDARQNKISSPMLEEWYRRYGASLCKQAARRLGLQ